MPARPSASTVLDHFARTTEQIVGRESFVERLESGRPLRIKYGVDCTAPDLHLGHAVNLWLMRYLQDHGHRVVFLIGDLTTRIGDPTDRSETRPVLSAEQIDRNATAYLDQVTTVLRTDDDLLEIRRNSEWLEPLGVGGLLDVLALVTHGRLIARDMFAERIKAGADIAGHELIYPVLQGYDSFAMDSDLTIVGTDQLYNEMMGRHLQQRLGAEPQVVITTKITPGLDGGPKQSKSLGNYVGLVDSPQDKFGKLMRLLDPLIETYATVYSDLPEDRITDLARRAELGGRDARDAKLDVAEAVVARYHGAETAARERAAFLSLFSARELPDELPTLTVDHDQLTVIELLRLARPDASRSELLRLIVQGGVSLDGTKLTDPDAVTVINSGAVIKLGKRDRRRLQR
ncbi:tyrosine--tRNA ligase [Microlunatus parietis]|uniref:Tyrosine--tRNA ligase n=1 Tax=Microlunatus parietis TaxID=682979 RepID=A0A7Y9I8T3_9ACTN|nr:tyrosine--tRNA ligase [Microlunatus parietis]NYE72444.1 tyrosyl-tRNA synthetase [Microlunatus parietis]